MRKSEAGPGAIRTFPAPRFRAGFGSVIPLPGAFPSRRQAKERPPGKLTSLVIAWEDGESMPLLL